MVFFSDIHYHDNTLRPKNWTGRVKMHDGRTVTFWYDKLGNFYG